MRVCIYRRFDPWPRLWCCSLNKKLLTLLQSILIGYMGTSMMLTIEAAHPAVTSIVPSK